MIVEQYKLFNDINWKKFETVVNEYVEVTNLGDQPQDLANWVLKDISEGYPSFIFPSYILAPGKNIRVYTNE